MLKELFRKTTDIVFVNLLWMLVSFLGILITLGAATTAMFSVTFQILKKNEPTNVLHQFIQSFKENFVISTLVWLSILAVGIPLYMMFNYAINTDQMVLLIIGIVGGYQLLMFTIFVFPVISRFKTETNRQLLKNVLLLSNMNLWTNFKLIGSLAFVVLLIVFVHEMMILIGIGFYGILVSFHLNKLFEPYLMQFRSIEDEEGN
ncbi:YesL family protein [Peloplasma aerotolerans]|jgi:uncharacterized membrane protein YesL|uniref:DUF624 domain-containing protein n=1 Tax=Peloplasma aerotolerans TaxID=3044389 RepID=A0AAW6UBV4_9MOLU|nr:DUF624 domain-containing protein [Mariniplasma sp. M4Ah]MDI6453114.1 DUF624 domain-containing protein [Mariniplasma sp. M4Ah]